MNTTHIIGVDPGLVHTGVVRMLFEPRDREVHVEHIAIDGPDAAAVRAWAVGHGSRLPNLVTYNRPSIFIEGYRPRSNLNSDARMVEAVSKMRDATKGTVLLNTGVKQVVSKDLMELLGVWKFSTVTHHQDLRSAARIAILGMLKDEQLNRVVYDVVEAHIRGRTWTVRT